MYLEDKITSLGLEKISVHITVLDILGLLMLTAFGL